MFEKPKRPVFVGVLPAGDASVKKVNLPLIDKYVASTKAELINHVATILGKEQGLLVLTVDLGEVVPLLLNVMVENEFNVIILTGQPFRYWSSVPAVSRTISEQYTVVRTVCEAEASIRGQLPDVTTEGAAVEAEEQARGDGKPNNPFVRKPVRYRDPIEVAEKRDESEELQEAIQREYDALPDGIDVDDFEGGE